MVAPFLFYICKLNVDNYWVKNTVKKFFEKFKKNTDKCLTILHFEKIN